MKIDKYLNIILIIGTMLIITLCTLTKHVMYVALFNILILTILELISRRKTSI